MAAKIKKRTSKIKKREPDYKMVALAMARTDIAWLDTISQTLRQNGIIKASRSMVIKEAIARLREDIASLKPDALVASVVDRQAKRAKRA